VSFLPQGVVTLLTDLGLKDPFVGIMKGLMISRFQQVRIVDLCHGVPAHDITWASYALAGSFRNFPPGSVHCVVVDPGAGHDHSILVGERDGHVFVAPDNGLLTHVLSDGGEARVVDLDRVPVAPVRRTFHNRDIIAPLGALLASGKLALEDVGEVCDNPVVLAPHPTTCTPTSVEGVVVGEDRFGNLFTSISESDLPETEGEGFVVELSGHCIPLMASYGQALPGKVLALFNVFGLLEVAIRNGSASEQLEWERGCSVVVRAVTD